MRTIITLLFACIRPLLVAYFNLFQINLPPRFAIADVSHYLRSKSFFWADIALFYYVPCCKLHCAPKIQCVKKFNIIIVQTLSFCVFSSVKKTGYDVIK